MTARRKTQAQALPVNRRRATPQLQVVPRNVVSAAGQSVSSLRPALLRDVDFHPGLYMLAGVAILTIIAFIYLGQVNAVGNANYTLQQLQSEHTALLRAKQDLQLPIAGAQSLPRIEDAARTRLHMVPIGDKYQYLTIAPGPVQIQESGAALRDNPPATPNP